MEKSYTSRSIFVLILSAVIVFFVGCCDCKKPVKNYKESEYTFILDPKLDNKNFCDSLKRLFPSNKSIVCTRCGCDSLVLVEGLDNVTISGQSGQVVASNNVPAQGGNLPGVLQHGRNYFLDFPIEKESKSNVEELYRLFKTAPVIEESSPRPLLIGVIDTGLDKNLLALDFVNQLPQEGIDTCYNNDKNGWNFIGKNNDVHDEDPGRHGTFVTQLMVAQGIGKNVKIMPLKVLDSTKNGQLFHVMCAMAYAEKKNVNIINASLGYYGQPDPVFEKYLDRLNKKNILLVTSSGNESLEKDKDERDIFGVNNVRDLEKRINKFYPACYNDKYSNIISVTTANNIPRASSVQNYSSKFVDIGVIPNSSTATGSNPVFQIGSSILPGSSFATPVVTGRIIKTIVSDNSLGSLYGRELMLWPHRKLIGLNASNAIDFKKEVNMGFYIKQ